MEHSTATTKQKTFHKCKTDLSQNKVKILRKINTKNCIVRDVFLFTGHGRLG